MCFPGPYWDKINDFEIMSLTIPPGELNINVAPKKQIELCRLEGFFPPVPPVLFIQTQPGH